MKVVAVCQECNHKHSIEHDPERPDHQFTDWYAKHCGHRGVTFSWPQRTPKKTLVPFNGRLFKRTLRVPSGGVRNLSGGYRTEWVYPSTRYVEDTGPNVYRPLSPRGLYGLLDNSDVKIAYGASASPTFTLASLAASSSLLSGRESTAVDNGASVKYLDWIVGGNYRAAASNNQAGSIYTCVVSALNDTPTWFDGFDGTDSTLTVTKSGVFNAVCKFLSVIAADATASQNWPFSGASVAGCFGGVVPDQFVYAVFHNVQTSTNAWNSAGNTFSHTPVYATVV